MFKVKSFLFALLLSQTNASSFLRSLSEELFISYEPQTTVTDHAAIDLDQQAIESQLATGTEEGFAAALRIYQEGAFSKSYAEVKLDTALTMDLPAGTEIVGSNSNDDEIRGTLLDEAEAGDVMVRVQYSTTGVQASYVTCQVGANPDPVFDGCLKPTGSIRIGALGEQSYTYDPATGNKNGRTIQGFSTGAKAKMYDCEKCPYPTYKKFYDYYGAFDYGDKWVQAAFAKAQASFDNGSANFGTYTGDGLVEAIKKGTAYLNIWMYVIRELEDAIDDCENSCPTESCNDDQVHAWDEAVAFYTGSIPKASGDGGVLLYTLAQKRCENFGTCVQSGEEAGMSSINYKIFKHFIAGKQSLQQGRCSDAQATVAEIINLMAVPMIQGTLRYAHIIGEQGQMSEKAEAEGATFAAAVLPILHACNPSDAATVYNNMRVGSGTSKDFAAVKKAFEDNYDCMQVSCADVGGLLQADLETYFDGAKPCGGATIGGDLSMMSSSAFSFGMGLAVGLSTLVLAALA